MSQTTTQTKTQTQTLHTLSVSPAPSPQSRVTFAKFNYYLAPSEESSTESEPSTDDLELILGNKNQDTRRLPVHDLRGRFDEFELDECGFQVVRIVSELDGEDPTEEKRESSPTKWEDDESIRRVYYPEVEGLVRGV